MADQQTGGLTLQDLINKAGQPAFNLALQQLFGPGVDLSSLGGAGIGTVASLLPGLIGDKANPALTMMASNLAQTLPAALGITSGPLAGVPGTLSLNGIVQALNSGIEALGLGSNVLGSVAPIVTALNPVSMMGAGMSEGWTNPYSGIVQMIDMVAPVLGSVLGGWLDFALGGSRKQENAIKEAIAQTDQPGIDRLQQLRNMGLTDYDIYAFAKANNLYTEGMNDQLTGVWTGPETNALNEARGAWSGGLDTLWRWDPTNQTWSQRAQYDRASMDNAYGMNSTGWYFSDPYGPSAPQQESPSSGIQNYQDLVGSPTRTSFSERSSDPASWGQTVVLDPTTRRVVYENGLPKMQDLYNSDYQWQTTYGPNNFDQFVQHAATWNAYDPATRPLGYYDPKYVQGMQDWLMMHPEDISKIPEEIKPFLSTTPSQYQWSREITNPEYNAEMYQKYLDWNNANIPAFDPWAGGAEGQYVSGTTITNPYEQYNKPQTITQNYWDMPQEEQLQWILGQMGTQTGTTPTTITDTTFYGTPTAPTESTTTTPVGANLTPNVSSKATQTDLTNQYYQNYPTQQTTQNRLAIQKSFPQYASYANVGQWTNPKAWEELYNKTLYGSKTNSNIYGY